VNNSVQKKGTPPKAFLQPKVPTKKQRIVECKIKNPHLSLKEIARKTNTQYPYVRKVWSQYKKKTYTIKGSPISPLPFTTQDFGFAVDGSKRWYLECPVVPSGNRNRQKVYRCAFFTAVFHVKGSVLIHPWHEDWRGELRDWLDTWMLSTEADLFLEYINPLNQKHVCVPAPGVPVGYRFKVPGVGTLTTDRTPYPQGTLEYEFDPGFGPKLDGIIDAVEGNNRLIEKQIDSMEIFAEGMREHMKLIDALQGVSGTMMTVLEEIKKWK